MATPAVTPVSVARAQLTTTLKRFRGDPDAQPVVFGAHERPEAVVIPYAQFIAGARAESVRARLHELAPTIERLANASRLSAVELFGSVARGEDRADSDIDLIVTAQDDAGYFDIARFALDVERVVGRSVDVVIRSEIDPATVIGRHILDEAIPL